MTVGGKLYYLFSILSCLNFSASMLVIAMVAACFLGRRIVITRKMILINCGVMLFMSNIYSITRLIAINIPEIKNAYETGMITEELVNRMIQMQNHRAEWILLFNLIFVFCFYYVAYQEKKFLRAMEATICFFAYRMYLGLNTSFTYVYLSGGRYEVMKEIIDGYGADFNRLKRFQCVLLICINVLLVVILYIFYYRKKQCYVVRVRHRIFFVAWLLIVMFAPLVPFMADEENLEEQYEMVCFEGGVVIPLLGFVVPGLLVMSAAKRYLKEHNEFQERYLEAELEYVKRYKETQAQTRAFRHDVINQLSLATMLMENGKGEEAKQHLEEMLGNIQNLSLQYVTGDEMLDCIVSMKADKMEERGIAFTLEGVADDGLGMKAMDVCGVFANALDNAIEAASKVAKEQDAATPKISMEIKRTPRFFVIKITNSTQGKVNVETLLSQEGYTSKKDTESHGFGLYNVQRHIEKYDGMIKAQSAEGEFSLSVLIPRGDAKEMADGGKRPEKLA